MPNEVFDSLILWANKAMRKVQELDDYEDMTYAQRLALAYDAYSGDLPAEYANGKKKLKPYQKQRMNKTMKEVEAHFSKNLNMYSQDHVDETIKEDIDKHGGDSFAYFMEYRKPTATEADKKGQGRITLNFDPAKADKAFGLLAQYLTSIEGSKLATYINQLKVLGPKDQGDRTDSGIIYLHKMDDWAIKKIAADIGTIFKANGIEMYNHTPYGMKPLATELDGKKSDDQVGQSGFSYSQQGPFSSSHGLARAKIIVDAMDRYAHDDSKSMRQVMTDVLTEGGYNAEKPESLDLINYLDNYDTTTFNVAERKELLQKIGRRDPEMIFLYREAEENFAYELQLLGEDTSKIKGQLYKAYQNEELRQELEKMRFDELNQYATGVEDDEEDGNYIAFDYYDYDAESDDDDEYDLPPQEEVEKTDANPFGLSLALDNDEPLTLDLDNDDDEEFDDLDQQQLVKEVAVNTEDIGRKEYFNADIKKAMEEAAVYRFKALFGKNPEIEALIKGYISDRFDETRWNERFATLQELREDLKNSNSENKEVEFLRIEKEEKEIRETLRKLSRSKTILKEYATKIKNVRKQKKEIVVPQIGIMGINLIPRINDVQLPSKEQFVDNQLNLEVDKSSKEVSSIEQQKRLKKKVDSKSGKSKGDNAGGDDPKKDLKKKRKK